MNKYHCEFIELREVEKDKFYARVKLLDDHKGFGGNSGEIYTIIKLIDFERKFLVTQNSIYTW